MLTLTDFFCGAGGSAQGAVKVPGVRVNLAANHWNVAIASHAANFPEADHFCGDLHDTDVATLPASDLFWASPECPQWSNARGKRRDFDTQPTLDGLDEPLPDAAVIRSRALMWDVPRYLEAMALRGKPVLAGVVENVIEVRAWSEWKRWVTAIRNLGYRTRLIALNSMHAQDTRTPRAPQSRDRLYLAYWRTDLRRDPDWNTALRPLAHCPGCDTSVRAVQVFKNPNRDMGRYRQSYVYRCPSVTCRNSIVEPDALPAAVAIDWTIPAPRIGDRAKPLADKTLARIQAGLDRFARPITLDAAGHTFERRPGVRTWPVDAPLTTQTTTATKALAFAPMMVPAGGSWRDAATLVTEPMPTRTTRENDGVAIPPLLIAVEGREGKHASPVDRPLRTQTARLETALAVPPYVVELRGGSSTVRPIDHPLATVTASGNHLGLATPLSALVMRNNNPRGDLAAMTTPVTEPLRTLTTAGHQSLLVPYYSTGVASPVTEPIGTLSTHDRYALAEPAVDIDDVGFRMLVPAEIGRAMAFADDYVVTGTRREQVRQYGNAVTPPIAEILIAALVDAIANTRAVSSREEH